MSNQIVKPNIASVFDGDKHVVTNVYVLDARINPYERLFRQKAFRVAATV